MENSNEVYTNAGKWDYSKVDDVCYSDPKCESYKKAAAFLGDSVEDWGGGTGWARRYFSDYRNIDCNPHKRVDEVVDLTSYSSNVDNILIRQVLESNTQWRDILENAMKSFNKKLCIVLGTPFVRKTREGPKNPVPSGGYIQEMYFKKKDILDYFPESGGYKVSSEYIKTNQYYHKDWILYVEKIS